MSVGDKMRNHLGLFFACSFGVAGAISSTHAQDIPLDEVDRAIVSVFQMNNSKYLCLASTGSLPVLRKGIEVYLQQQGLTGKPDANDVARAAYTLYPCPFSPYRDELRPASAQEIEGVWLYPEASQKLRFGPRSPMWSQFAAMPIKCEGVAYYPEGELRSVQAAGRMACPFSVAADMDLSRSNPWVASWKVIREGVVDVARMDVAGHIEEWEVFTVVTPFDFHGIRFGTGELVAYLRRERGNDFNAATTFRHLRRLP